MIVMTIAMNLIHVVRVYLCDMHACQIQNKATSFVDHLCYLYLVFVMLSCLFIVALWSPAGKGLTSWLRLRCLAIFP